MGTLTIELPAREDQTEFNERRWAELLADAEIREKTALYFDAGAREVWICADSGAVTFFRAGETTPLQASAIFADGPSQIVLV